MSGKWFAASSRFLTYAVLTVLLAVSVIAATGACLILLVMAEELITSSDFSVEALAVLLVLLFATVLAGGLAFLWMRSRQINVKLAFGVSAGIAGLGTLLLLLLMTKSSGIGEPSPIGNRSPHSVDKPSLPPSLDTMATVTEPPPPVSYQDFASLDSAAVGVKVYYGTDRVHSVSDIPGRRYTGRAADSLQFGTLIVNVPSYRRRAVGEINVPPLIRSNPLWYMPNAERDMFIVSLSPMDSVGFFSRLSSDAEASADILLFVHGYNVSFEAAALRVAQLSADLNYPGIPVLYSWASRGETVGYVSDLTNARNSGAHLARFIRTLRARTPYATINIVTHSMGAEVFADALAALRGDTLRLDQIVLIAPDLDVRLFRRDILPQMRQQSNRVTVYASNEDRALRASRALHGVWRLGLGGDSLVVLKDMDTIDATRVRTDFLGHGSFGSTAFLEDLFGVLVEGQAPPRRLLQVPQGELAFYRFRTTGN